MLEVHGPTEKGRWQLTPFMLQKYREWFKKQKDGSIICAKFWKQRKHKSWSQVKTHWSLVLDTIKHKFDDDGIDTSYFIKGCNKPTGIPVSKEMIHDVLYSYCPMYAEDGELITMSDERCTTVVQMKWFDDIRNFCASNWGIHIPDPDSLWKDNHGH